MDSAGVDEIGGARVLDSLREALAGWPDLGSWTRVSIEQWSNFTASEAKAYQDISISAVRGVAGWRAVADQIRALGRLRYEPAIPTLIGLWEQCPIQPVQVAAAHALLGIGTGEARDVLRQGIHDHDHLARFMALMVMFTDEGTAWDNVSHLFSDDSLGTLAGQTAAVEALSLLSPRSFSRSGPEWHSDKLRDLVSQDRRWLDLCVALRDHESLGRQARQVLKYADPAVTGPALDAARAVRAAQPQPVIRQLRSGEFVARYENGDHRGVWRDLGTVAHLDGSWRAEAEQVAAATMERVRRNALSLTSALIARGWALAVAGSAGTGGGWNRLGQPRWRLRGAGRNRPVQPRRRSAALQLGRDRDRARLDQLTRLRARAPAQGQSGDAVIAVSSSPLSNLPHRSQQRRPRPASGSVHQLHAAILARRFRAGICPPTPGLQGLKV